MNNNDYTKNLHIMKTNIILLCSLCAAAFVSCEDNGQDNQTPVAGNIVKEITLSSNDGSFDGASGIAFSTDNQGRTIDIAAIALTGEKASTGSYTYGNGIVTVNRITGPARGPITYTMTNGRVTEDQYRCEKWTYNADGTLAGYKADFTGSEFENNFEDTEVTYRWSDGNITSCDIKNRPITMKTLQKSHSNIPG